MNWAKFALAATYGIIVFLFYFAYLIPNVSNLPNDILYVGGLIMLGILMLMIMSLADSK